MKKLLLSLLLILSLTSCATTPSITSDITTGKTLIATKDTIINLHESFRVPCKTGTIPADTCKEVDKLTNESKLIYDSAADAALVYLRSGTTSDLASYQAQQAQFVKLLGDITALSIKYGTKSNTEVAK